MNTRHVVGSLTVLLLGCCAAAHAEWRCDCTSIVDSCSADVAIRGSWVEVTTDHQQCARVDYFIDGLPFVSVVVEGSDRQNWIARTENPRVMVQSCQVCRDNAGAQQPVARRPATDADGSLQPLIKVAPTYPAQGRGLPGTVELEFTVTPAGDVESPRVIAAQPASLFDQAALAAVSRWRYPADPERAAQTVRDRVDFTAADAAATAAANRPSAPPAPASGPRNQCVRESGTYHFGDMVEIGLMNACDEPLLVFGCAEGTGRNAGRWVCIDSEAQRSLLVPPSDARIGARGTAGAQSYTYADSFFVMRAPNSQYWWIACLEGDANCRADARQWTRSVDRQLATVDPQARGQIAVARSL